MTFISLLPNLQSVCFCHFNPNRVACHAFQRTLFFSHTACPARTKGALPSFTSISGSLLPLVQQSSSLLSRRSLRFLTENMSDHTNTFLAEEVRSSPVPYCTLKKFFKPTTTWYPPTDYPIGLNCLNLGRTTDVRISSYFSNVKFNETDQAFDATIHLDVSDTTIDKTAAGCQWFDNYKHDCNFQHGKLTLKPNELYRYEKTMLEDKLEQLIENILFPREFGSQPAVIVWLSGFDVRSIGDWRFSVSAIDITSRGFKILGEVWGTTNLNSMEASWIAYPALRPNIESGLFSTNAVLGWDQEPQSQSQQENSQIVNFQKKFERLPRVYFALNKISSPHKSNYSNLRLKAYTTDTTTKGMTVHLDSWGNSELSSSSGQWIAVQDYRDSKLLS